jgi:hypothetical protein
VAAVASSGRPRWLPQEASRVGVDFEKGQPRKKRGCWLLKEEGGGGFSFLYLFSYQPLSTFYSHFYSHKQLYLAVSTY